MPKAVKTTKVKEEKVVKAKAVKSTVAKKPAVKKTVVKKAAAKKETAVKSEVKASTVSLNPSVWEVPMNQELVAQVLFVQQMNARTGTAHAKNRSQVSGGGKKPWKQKGTGRARVGSNRSPIWVKGGVTFVPNDRNWERKVNKKMVNKAICMMLSERLKDEVVVFVSMDKKDKKNLRTKLVSELTHIKNALIISNDNSVKLGVRNVENVNYVDAKEFSVIQLVKARKLLIDNDVVKMIEERFVNGK